MIHWIPSIALISLFILLYAEFKKILPLKAISKTISALLFLLYGYLLHTNSGYQNMILVGLGFSVLGDVLLIPKNKMFFLGGLSAFLLAHIFYGIAFFPYLLFSWEWILISMIPVFAGTIFYIWIYSKLDKFKIPVLSYLIVIHFMVLTAIGMFLNSGSISSPSEIFQSRNTLALIGAILFYLSDFAVARERFVVKSFVNKLWGLPFYFIGQFLIAYSMAWN